MSILKIRAELEQLKKAVKPDSSTGIMVIYNTALVPHENPILQESIVEIDGLDASQMSVEKIQTIISNAKMVVFIPDNGRDSGQ